MAIYTTAGARFYIGTTRPHWWARPVFDGDFTGEAWTEIGSVSSLGRASGEWQTSDAADLSSRWSTSTKTMAPKRVMQVAFGTDADDAGQVLLLQAEASTEAFAFRITLPDGTERYFVALVLGLEDGFDAASSIMTTVVSLALQSDLCRPPI